MCIVKKKKLASTSILMKLALFLLILVCVSNSSVGRDIFVNVDMIREAFVSVENLAVEKLKTETVVKVKVWLYTNVNFAAKVFAQVAPLKKHI